MADFLPLPEKEYSVIYADPPWEYRQHGTTEKSRGTALKQYPTMTTADICNLPVRKICGGGGAACFLWATFPNIAEGIRVLEAWGFQYKTAAFVWVKKNAKSGTNFWGMGAYTRANAEVCLLATRGHPKRQAANVHQFIISPIQEHSRKPEEAREKIVALMGDLPRVELFARQSPPGWDVWGNEVEPTIPDFWTKCPEEADQKEGL